MVHFLLSLILGSVTAHANSAQEHIILQSMSTQGLSEVRQIDGSNNNLLRPEAGTPLSPFSRMSKADYGNGVDSPARRTQNPRAISVNFHQTEETENYKGASDFLWLWGQFMDHDVTLTDVNKEEPMHFSVPKCDRFFDLSCTGTNEMVFVRSESIMLQGVREQFNRTTSYIDGSMVYGADEERAQALRTLDGTGKMILDSDGHLPKNLWGLQNLPNDSPHFFAAGDIRANDHIGLMAIHNLFVREHNYWAEKIFAKAPNLNGEELYQRARAIVIAEIQNITFHEFLPIVIGHYAPSVNSRFNPRLESSILNEFSSAAFRMGHTLVSGNFFLESPEGVKSTVRLRDSFFNPNEYKRAGLDSILLGFSKHKAQRRDPLINTELQNFLMIFPEEGIFDLFAFNIQRGRDHGIPSYNDLRDAIGFTRVTSFGDVSAHKEVNRGLAKAYRNVDEIDPWLGMIAEKASNNALLGPTASHIIGRQFKLLRDSDRFWFTHIYDKSFVEAIKSQRLSDVIKRNSRISKHQIGENAFLVR